MRRILSVVMMLVAIFGATSAFATGAAEDADGERTTIRIGFFPGPYADMFTDGVQPVLEEQGYTIRKTELSSPREPNFALVQDELDMNIFQHTAFMEQFNRDADANLTPVVQVPTAALGVYSDRYESLDEVSEGMLVAIPNDPTNLARALRLLEQVGWITLDPEVELLEATERDVVENSAGVEFRLVEAAQLPRSLADVDYAVITGNHVTASGMSLADSLFTEDPPDQFMIVAVVASDDVNAGYTEDIVAVYGSEEFQAFARENYEGYAFPDYFGN